MPEETAVLSHDPGAWPVDISRNDSDILVRRGPKQIIMDFPVNKNGRRFTVNCYRRRMANGEEVSRSWLIYSVSKDAIYCFCCRIFSKVRLSLSSEIGFNDWKHMSELLSEHERSPGHMKAFQSWKECSLRLEMGKTIDAEHQKMIQAEVGRWQEVLKRIIIFIQFLGSQNLAFRGSSDQLYVRENGNFLKLVEFVGKFDPVIAEHMRKITCKESYVHYLGKNIQNEIIELLGSLIRDQILSEVQKSKYYSVILDCTPDVSRTEQMTLVLRYVLCDEVKYPEVKERFLCFIPIESSTGEALTDVLLSKLNEMNLPIGNMRGQGYDNGSNMRGKNAGVQKRILDINPRAFFVPCSAHTLNLVVNDSALSCTDAVNFFMVVQEMYNYLSASTHRWTVLKKHVSALTVKPLSNTRWESRIDAIGPVRYQAGEIYDALLELSTDPSGDAYAKSTALGLAKKLKNFKFICCLVVWNTILSRINVISKLLQKEDFDIAAAMELIASVKSYFNEIRSDKGFEEMLVDAREVAESLEVEPSFPSEQQVRPRRVKRQFDDEVRDEAVVDPKVNFRSKCYFYILDTTIASLEERFSQLSTHNDTFGFLYKLKREDINTLMTKCADLQISLTDGEHRDVEGHQMYQELLVLKTVLPDDCGDKPKDILKFISSHSLSENFPNVCVALRILLSLPVSVASGERSFSKLKLIKNYLRSTMSQERLVGLALMSIEYDVLQRLDLSNIIRDFAEKKARKVAFVN